MTLAWAAFACGEQTPSTGDVDAGADGGWADAEPDARAADADVPDADSPDADAADGGVADGGPADAAPDSAVIVTYDNDVQTLLATKCGECHSEDAPYDSSFATSYAALSNPTTGFNSGCDVDGTQLLLGECVVVTARHQREWSTLGCNSEHPGQYHRDYSWPCLTASEVELLEAWAIGGMLET